MYLFQLVKIIIFVVQIIITIKYLKIVVLIEIIYNIYDENSSYVYVSYFYLILNYFKNKVN